jgi:hypothetical protein
MSGGCLITWESSITWFSHFFLEFFFIKNHGIFLKKKKDFDQTHGETFILIFW